MKKLLLICLIFLFGNQVLKAQLAVGDIAFIGMNEDNYGGSQDHSFSWISLTDISPNEIIYFTEQGIDINLNSWFGNTEGHYAWTAPSGGLTCGTVVYIYQTPGTDDLVATSGTCSLSAGSGWNLSGGDQVIAYQASFAKPSISSATFLAGIHKEGDHNYGKSNGWTSTTYAGTGTANSNLPPGLTNGVNCIAVFDHNTEYDNVKYTGTLTGNTSVLRGYINDKNNWTFDLTNSTALNINSSAYSPNVVCTTPCTDPDVPTVQASASSICPNGNSTLSWTGSLNDATAWHIYTTGCGSTQLTTTTSNSLVVSPSSNTTYYVRAEGGCVTPSTCGTAAISTDDNTDPVIHACAAAISAISSDWSCEATAPDLTGTLIVTDNCTSTPTITQLPLSGSTLNLGVTAFTFTATDAAGNDETCSINVTVLDDISPILSCPGNQTLYANASCEAIAPDFTSDAFTSDNCSGVVSVSQTPIAGTVLSLGNTTFTFTATDAAGNSTSDVENCTMAVTVVDTTRPTLSCPGNQVQTPTSNCQTALADYTGLALSSDNCSGSPTITQVPAAGTSIGLGTTTVMLTSEDAAGNKDSCSFSVVVNSSETETLDSTICNGASFLYNGTLYNGSNLSGVETLTGEASNGCDLEVTVTVTELQAIDISVNNSAPVLTANQTGSTYQWLDCDNQDAPISLATNQIYTAISDGNYAVQITEGTCIDTSACENVNTTGTKEVLTNMISVYPNPTNGILFIKLKENAKEFNYSILTVEGRIVTEGTTFENNVKVDLTDESKGIYFLFIQDESITKTYKVIKK